jgi:RNA polymerase sigma-70 factor (ECF subfamily)
MNYLRDINSYQKIKLEHSSVFSMLDTATPEQVCLNKEFRNLIELTINLLPQKCRLIFFMVREEGLQYKEIAEILSISDRTVHAQMCIALKKIGEVIKEYYFGKEQLIKKL